jgi:export-related chaperone CsaA|tara:strand:+ start:501 stop:860 length:360 start_codon:yes stop_codon:yes gene_type:complete
MNDKYIKSNFINFSDFLKVDIRIGTVVTAIENDKLKKPSIILEIDFGNDIGIKKSSAQLQSNYKSIDLIDRQVAAVVNFEPKQIGNIVSEVLVLGFPDNQNQPILISLDKKLKNGGRLF